MWIDKKRQAETEQRKGLSTRAGIVMGALFIGVFFSYIFTGWLFSSGLLSTDYFYGELAVPVSVSPTIIRIALVLAMVLAVQFVAIMGMALANPENRKRPGQPTVVAQSQDFYGN